MPDDDKKLKVSEVPESAADGAENRDDSAGLDAERNRAARAAGKARREAERAEAEAKRAGTLRLNSLGAPPRKAPKRLGRGPGSGTGKTAGRGHKGARSRSGARRGRAVFEGGQTPLQRRLPKRGFVSRMALTTAQIRTGELAKLEESEVDLEVLKKRGLAPKNAKRARVFLSGDISRAVNLNGIPATAGARALIEKAGGKVNPPPPKPDKPAKSAKSDKPDKTKKAAKLSPDSKLNSDSRKTAPDSKASPDSKTGPDSKPKTAAPDSKLSPDSKAGPNSKTDAKTDSKPKKAAPNSKADSDAKKLSPKPKAESDAKAKPKAAKKEAKAK